MALSLQKYPAACRVSFSKLKMISTFSSQIDTCMYYDWYVIKNVNNVLIFFDLLTKRVELPVLGKMYTLKTSTLSRNEVFNKAMATSPFDQRICYEEEEQQPPSYNSSLSPYTSSSSEDGMIARSDHASYAINTSECKRTVRSTALQSQFVTFSSCTSKSDRILRAKQQRLLLLHHAMVCKRSSSECKLSKICAKMKLLWGHIQQCGNESCKVKHCCSSRTILRHFINCCEDKCRICLPARNIKLKKNIQQCCTKLDFYSD